MAEKVNVSQALAKAIEFNLERISKSDFLKDQSKAGKWSSDINLPLNDISLYELAEILINGYKVEETPEERLLKIYQAHEERPSIQPVWNDGVVDGIKMALDTLNIKIKGINE